jgi:hypothetical protein
MRIASITVDLQDVKSVERSEKKKTELENKGWHYVETQVDEALQMAVIYYQTYSERLGIHVEKY